MALGKKSSQSGFILPLVVALSVLMLIGIYMIAINAKATAKNIINVTSRAQSDSNTNAVIQKGLILLSNRLAYLNNRIELGIPDADAPGGTRFITDDDISRYSNTTPASFWVEWLNDIEESGVPVPDQPNFILENPNTVSFEMDNSSYNLKVSLISGVNLAPVQAQDTSGYNNVTLRYGYIISAKEKYSGRGKSETISSSMKAQHIENLIQIHLARELSRYNLFAINNKLKSTSQPIYDRTSYLGKIYSGDIFYVAGDPRYSDTIEISGDIMPPTPVHKDGIAFAFQFSTGGPNTPISIPALSLPDSVSKNDQKDLCHKMSQGQNPSALSTKGIYIGTELIGGSQTPTSIYVNNNGADATIVISVPSPKITRYLIQLPGVSDVTINQDGATNASFNIFVDGNALVEGTIARGTKLSINADNNIIITNSLQYEGGIVSSNTVMGLVSWEGDVLVSKSIPPVSGQTYANIKIHAVIMAVEGGFGAEGYENFPINYSGYKGSISHQGSIIRKWCVPTLSADATRGWGLSSGYDPYLENAKAPPYFPGNGRYNLVDEELGKVIELYLRKN